MTDGYRIGAILEGSWGYDQTNIDYYRIERRTNDTLWLGPLETVHVSEAGFMSERVGPGERAFGPTIRRKLCRRDGEAIGCRYKPSYGWISLWDGRPSVASHYA